MKAAPVSSSLEGLVASGALESDPAQAALARRLDALDHELARRPGLFRRPRPVRGVYIWGAAGRGKTLLMDRFFRLAREPRKRRVHFHAFMAEVHDRLATLRSAAGVQPIAALARQLAAETRLICLDEVQVKDIADATVLGRLFGELVARGAVIVATSNAPPARLYWRGLNRDLFLPFIALIEREFDVIELRAARDFRLERLSAGRVWHVPPDRAAMDAAFQRLGGAARGDADSVPVKGREVPVPEAQDGVARFGFADLCEQPLGAADFAAIARRFHTVLIDGIPQLDAVANDAVRRFILLIDELYEHRVKLVASAAAEPQALLTSGPLAWEFRRTASRLAEMGSHDWLALPHGANGDLNGGGEPG